MKWLSLFLTLSFVGCTVTVTPITKKPVKRTKITHRHEYVGKKYRVPSRTADVDSEWLKLYDQLKATHGHYDIPSEHEIHVLPDGKIRVPAAVINHFEDLNKTPPATPTP